MRRWQLDQRVAAVLGLIGGALGVVVGLVQALFGARIPNLTGDKADPVALGLLTIMLSLITVLSAMVLLRRASITAGPRLAAAIGLLVPGSLCFSTGGLLWFLPGAVMFTGGVYAVLAGDPARTRQVVRTTWLHVLISLLGAFELLMAVSAGPVTTIIVGTVGGLALMVAPWMSQSAAQLLLLLIGTLPFAVITWWTVATPLLAVVALGIGFTVVHAARRVDHPEVVVGRLGTSRVG